MAWSGGTFTRLWTWASDSISFPNMLPSRFDTFNADMAGGINNCLTKDGQNSAIADLPMGGFKHTGVGNGSARTHYAALGQVQDGAAVWGGTSTGAANTYAVNLSPAITSYAAGLTISFNSHQANTGAVTLAVNGLAAQAITKNGTTALVAGDIASGKVITVVYDGTRFQMVTNVSDVQNEYADNVFRVVGSADATKKVAFEVDGLTTGTTRTLTVQDKSGTLPVIETANVLIPGTAAGPASLSLAEDTDNGTHAATIIAPASMAANRTLTLPDLTGTLAAATNSGTSSTFLRGDNTWALGGIVDRAYATYTATTGLTATIPLDNTVPQNTEGTEILSATINVKSATNRIRVRFLGNGYLSAGGGGPIAALFVNSETSARVAEVNVFGTLGYQIALQHEFVPGATGNCTVRIRIGPSSGTLTMNTYNGATLGGTMQSTLVLEEIGA